MTGTDIGLPASPVVDGSRHLTPEWLRALGEIETLKSLKDTYAEVAKADVSKLVAALDEVEAAFQEALARGIPNNIVSSTISISEATPWATGIVHGLGTASYIPMTIDPDGNVESIGAAAGNTMPFKNETFWSWTNTFYDTPGRTWFTFTITSEGAPQ